MMEDELVTKRKWLSKSDFMGLLGFTNLIPGPNSTELAIALGYKCGGKIGLFLAGICFILPATTIVLLLAMFYKQYGEVPLIEAIFAGIKPVILTVIIQALFRLGQTTIKNSKLLLLFLAAYLLSLLGVGEITILILTGLTMLLMQQLLDAVAIGQFTPGPVFTTATFVGYLIQGVPGALLATAGIFLPSVSSPSQISK